MPEILLSPKDRQALKARAHSVKPVVLLGQAGLTAPVIKEIDRALVAHQLIKIRVPGDDREQRDSVFAEVAEALSAARVQAIGKLLVLYRPAPPTAETAEASKAPARERSPKAPRPTTQARNTRKPSKPSAPKRTTPDRRDTERVNRGTPARRDPGASLRAVGRQNSPRRGGGRAR